MIEIWGSTSGFGYQKYALYCDRVRLTNFLQNIDLQENIYTDTLCALDRKDSQCLSKISFQMYADIS